MNKSRELILKIYRNAVAIRAFELAAHEQYANGLLAGSVHLYAGEEGVAAGICGVLNSDDYITSTHRGHGHLIAKGGNLKLMMAELAGKATGYYSRTGKGSSGLGLGYGTVAVDPDVIPYGTKLYITSTDGKFVYGYAVATDTGIAVQKGQILVDLFYETYAESVINGAIQVNVYVVD